jgi:hypothetical protein
VRFIPVLWVRFMLNGQFSLMRAGQARDWARPPGGDEKPEKGFP